MLSEFPVHIFSEIVPESGVIPSILYDPLSLNSTFVIVAPDTVSVLCLSAVP